MKRTPQRWPHDRGSSSHVPLLLGTRGVSRADSRKFETEEESEGEEVMAFFGVGIGVVIANFLYQALGAHDWSVAIDRSWFQVCAIFAVWLTLATRAAVSSPSEGE
jgi:hypothetical protein